MKQNRYIRKCGPFQVSSISQDGHGVRLVVYPAFPRYGTVNGVNWAISRLKGDGGGPGILTTIATAAELEQFLNQPYSAEEVAAWKATLYEALKDIRAKDQKRFDRAMARALSKMGPEAKP